MCRFLRQVMEDYDLCSKCRKKPEAEAYALFTEMRTAVPKGATITVPSLACFHKHFPRHPRAW